jgi:RNA polymerase sigma-70 factor, ECF subfamily
VTDDREALEQRIRDECMRGNLEQAATLALEAYGHEILGFLIARLGEQRGNEVFSEFLEDFWRGLPDFGWRSTLRTWAYTLARHATSRHLRNEQRRPELLSTTSAGLSALVERVRTETAAHLRTTVKDRLRELRARLPDDDQTLLILRVDRKLSWRDLACVMNEHSATPDEDELDKAAARMRQRFQAAKERLRDLAEAEGLLAKNEGDA